MNFRFLTYFPYILIASILVINLFLYFTHQMNPGTFSADILYLPALYKDIFVDGGSFGDWNLTPAPYYFPDMPLYFFSRFISGNYYYGIAIFSTLQSLLMIYFVYKIYRLFLSHNVAILLASIAFAFLYLYPTPTSVFMQVATIHYGEYTIGLWILYLTLKIVDSSVLKPYSLLLLLVLVALTGASDSSFFLHFVYPLLFGILILWAIKRIETSTMVMLTFIFLAGKLISGKIHSSFSIGLNLITGNNIKDLETIFRITYSDYKLDFFIIIATLLMAFVSLILKKRLNFLYQNYGNTTPIMLISLYLIIMSVAIVTILLLAPMPIATRYMIPLYEIPILMFPLYLGLLGFFRNTISQTILYILSFLLLVGSLIDAKGKLEHKTLHSSYYMPLAQCVDAFVAKTGAKYGISTYWNAKPIYIESRTGVILAQVDYNMQPDLKISSKSWQQPSYDFALIVKEDINRSKILKINGEPSKTYNCKDSKILYYKNKFKTQE